jgi:hypothetical protein
MKKMHKKLIKKIGSRMMFFITLNFYIILIVAMQNNGSVYVLFNHFNEAKIEYVMYGIILPFIFYSFIVDILEERRRRKERCQP